VGYTMEVPVHGLWTYLERKWGVSPRWRRRPFPVGTVILSYDAIFALAVRRVLMDHGIVYHRVRADGMPLLSRTSIARLIGISPQSQVLRRCRPMPLEKWLEHKALLKHRKGEQAYLRLQKIYWEAIKLAAKIWEDLERHAPIVRQHGRAWESLSRGGVVVSVQGGGDGDSTAVFSDGERGAQDHPTDGTSDEGDRDVAVNVLGADGREG